MRHKLLAGGARRGLKKMKPPLITKCQRRLSALSALRYQFLAARAAQSENRPKATWKQLFRSDAIRAEIDKWSASRRALGRHFRFLLARAHTWRVRLPTPPQMENFHGKRVHSPGWMR
jgi:hypothetical protein